jgi:hypothetical protein
VDKKQYAWDARDYAKHSEAQFSWAKELIEKLNLSGSESILDIGCGDGKVTAQIAENLPVLPLCGWNSLIKSCPTIPARVLKDGYEPPGCPIQTKYRNTLKPNLSRNWPAGILISTPETAAAGFMWIWSGLRLRHISRKRFSRDHLFIHKKKNCLSIQTDLWYFFYRFFSKMIILF